MQASEDHISRSEVNLHGALEWDHLFCGTFRGSQSFPSTHSILGRYSAKSRERLPVPIEMIAFIPKDLTFRKYSFASFVSAHHKIWLKFLFKTWPQHSCLLLILINCRQDPFKVTGFNLGVRSESPEKSPPLLQWPHSEPKTTSAYRHRAKLQGPVTWVQIPPLLWPALWP